MRNVFRYIVGKSLYIKNFYTYNIVICILGTVILKQIEFKAQQ